MPQDGKAQAEKIEASAKVNETPVDQSQRSWFEIPAPVKRVFDKFPLVTYVANDLPARTPKSDIKHALYVFTDPDDAKDGRPSFNPTCLKWQTYLKIAGLDFETVPSNNHASPTGSLPFLIPSTSQSSSFEAREIIPSTKLQKWAAQHGFASEESMDVRYEAFMSLIEHSIRRAWLYNVYLTANFESVVVPSYIDQASSSRFIRLTTAYELQTAASTELRKHSSVLDPKAIYRDAQEAFEALETLLDQSKWFFDKDMAGMFDAAVFAYTYLLLRRNQDEGWKDGTLCDLLAHRPGLVKHSERVFEQYYGPG